MKSFYTRLVGGLCLIVVLALSQHQNLQAQTISQKYVGSQPVISVGGMSAESERGNYSITLIAGQPFAQTITSLSKDNSKGQSGFYNQFLRAPAIPDFEASQGAFNDKVTLKWKPDPLQPAVNNPSPNNPSENSNRYQIRRDNVNLEIIDDWSAPNETVDLQVTPGKFYEYELTANNMFGSSEAALDIGFSNASGTIIGNVKTPNYFNQPGKPVTDVQMILQEYESTSDFLGNSFVIDGMDDYLKTEKSVLANNDSSFTIEAYLQVLSDGSNQNVLPIFSNMKEGDANINFRLENGIITLSLGQKTIYGASVDQLPAQIFADWVHVSASVSSEYTEIRLNGHLVGGTTGSWQLSKPTSSELYFGRNLSGQYYKGHMDEIRVWDSFRDSTELARYARHTPDSDHENLITYYKFNQSSGQLIIDWAGDSNLRAYNGGNFSTIPAPVYASSYTDKNGNYRIDGIPYDYNNGTQYTITPQKQYHNSFDPAQRTFLLKGENNVINYDFSDRSMINISGKVLFEGTQIGVDSAEIVHATKNADGTWGEFKSFEPQPVYANEDGEFFLTQLPGSDLSLQVRYKNHNYAFVPSGTNQFLDTYIIENLSQPHTGILFVDRTKYNLTVHAKGGADRYGIGQFDVELSGRFRSDVTYPESSTISGQTDELGDITFNNLPPLNYTVTVNHSARPDSIFFEPNSRIVSLTDSSTASEFIWRGPMKVRVDGLSQFTKTSGPIVLEQYEEYPVTVVPYEDYGNGRTTRVDSVEISIVDNISARTNAFKIPYKDQKADYSIKPYIPNLSSGGEHPYQFDLLVVAENLESGNMAQGQTWAVTEGIGEGNNTFISTSPQIPLMILHDPPGDNSYSYVEENSSTSTTLTSSWQSSEDQTKWVTGHFGRTFTTGFDLTPFGPSLDYETEIIADFTNGTSWSKKQNNSEDVTFEMTTSEIITTNREENLIGDQADLFIGATINFINGIARGLEWDDTGDSVRVYKDIISGINGFESTFVYTKQAIEENVIPNLLMQETADDSASARHWQSILDRNEQAKAAAELYTLDSGSSNISFSAGSEFERSVTTSETQKTFYEWEVATEWSEELVSGLRVSGTGATAGYSFKNRIGVGEGRGADSTAAETIGFVLSDNDANHPLSGRSDQFSVDLKTDPYYGTPVFSLVGGESSNPYEEGTLKRDNPQLSFDRSVITDVGGDEEAVFNVTLSNLSETEENRSYFLMVEQGTNPNGATIKINGVTIENGIYVTIPGNIEQNSVSVVMTVDRGIVAYEYEDIELYLYAADDPFIYDVKPFSVYFTEPCSEIAIYSPNNNFSINQTTGDTLEVEFFEYNRGDENLERVVLEYAYVGAEHPETASKRRFSADSLNGFPHLDFRANTAGKIAGLQPPVVTEYNWIEAASTPKEELEFNFDSINWPVGGLADGAYVMRVKTVCSTGLSGFSEERKGMKDTQGPELMAGRTPTPADGVLEPDDQIMIPFNEPMASFEYYEDSIRVVDLDRNELVAKSWTVEENMLYINLEEDNRFIENHELQVSINGISDKQGNLQVNPIEFSFYVDRSPVYWENGNLEFAMHPTGDNTFEFSLINNGKEEENFEILDLPQWLEAFPLENSIPPAGSRKVTFTANRGLDFGVFQTTILARTLNGDEPFVLELRVMPEAPDWTVEASRFEYNMSVIGELHFEDTKSEDPYDMVGAFVNGELRGSAPVKRYQISDSTHKWMSMLTVYSNGAVGDTVYFRAWNALKGYEYAQAGSPMMFEYNKVVGSISAPNMFETTNEIVYRKDLEAGWNWVSYNVDRTLDEIVGYIGPFVEITDGDMIKSQTEFLQYSDRYGWVGTLTDIDVTKGYLAKFGKESRIETAGVPVNTNNYPINLEEGWNLISYLGRDNYTLSYALQNGNFSAGDVIKSQTEFATYEPGFGWVGSLLFMKPTQSYMVKTSLADQLIYPNQPQSVFKDVKSGKGGDTGHNQTAGAAEIEPLVLNHDWEVNPYDYEFNMTVTAQVDVGDSLSAAEHYVLGAFSTDSDQLQGVAEPTLVNGDPYFFIMVYDSVAAGNEFTFKFLDTRKDSIISSDHSFVFTANQQLGSVSSPYTIDRIATSSENSLTPLKFKLSNNYPNPFNPETIIPYSTAATGQVRIVAYDLLGRKVATLVNKEIPAGNYQAIFNGSQLGSGMYIIRMEAGGKVFTQKVMLIK